MNAKCRKYLYMIGVTKDASLILTKKFARQADELREGGYVTFIPISSGGCYVALTQEGLDEFERQNPTWVNSSE